MVKGAVATAALGIAVDIITNAANMGIQAAEVVDGNIDHRSERRAGVIDERAHRIGRSGVGIQSEKSGRVRDVERLGRGIDRQPRGIRPRESAAVT